MATALDDPPTSLPAWARRLAELDSQAEILLDIVRTLASDVEEGAQSAVLAWAQAVRNSVRSHARDLDTMVPWCARASVLPSVADANPALAGLPELCRAVQEEIEKRVGGRRILFSGTRP